MKPSNHFIVLGSLSLTFFWLVHSAESQPQPEFTGMNQPTGFSENVSTYVTPLKKKHWEFPEDQSYYSWLLGNKIKKLEP